MSKIDSLLIFIYCVLLFFAGAVFGFIFSTDAKVNFLNFLSGISSLATVAAAATAIFALRDWHAQFKHSEKYKTILKFKESLDHGKTAARYIMTVCEMAIEKNSPTGMVSRKDMDNMESGAFNAWVKQSLKIEQVWKDMELILSKDEIGLFIYSPIIIDEDVRSIVEDIRYVTADNSSVDAKLLTIQYKKSSIRIEENSRAIVESCDLLLRKLLS